MRKKMLNWVEQGRTTAGPNASDSTYGANGAFMLNCPDGSGTLCVIASDGGMWDHVSVHVLLTPDQWPHGIPVNRTPTWEEMVYVKRAFFYHDEWAIEYHPADGQNINRHNYTLHLWRPQEKEIPTPPACFV